MNEPQTSASPTHLAPVAPDDHARGAADPRVTIVEYGDYDCPHTRRAQSVLERLLAENEDVAIVFRHFPLRHKHPHAEALSRLTEAADRQGKFWELHDRLLRHRTEPSQQAETDADAVGLVPGRLAEDAADPAIAERVERDVVDGKASGVHSTPTFFFNGVLWDGHYDFDTLSEKVRAARRGGD